MNLRWCANCHTTIPAQSKFCPSCGQKNSDGKISVLQLWAEFLDTVLNIDSKLFRTQVALFIPGKLTSEFFAGKHQSYIKPIRLFFFSGILCFGFTGLLVSELINDTLEEESLDNVSNLFHTKFLHQVDTMAQRIETELQGDDTIIQVAFDTLLARMKGNQSDSTRLMYFSLDGNGGKYSTKYINISNEHLINLSADTLKQVYNITNPFERALIRQTHKTQIDINGYVKFVLTQLIWVVLLTMPTLALLMKLIYLRRRKYYVEHLYFLCHVQSFAFVLIGLYTGTLFIASRLEAGSFQLISAWGGGIAPGIIFIFLLLALKRYYKQRWFKTFIKSCVIEFAYVMTILIFIAASALLSVLFF